VALSSGVVKCWGQVPGMASAVVPAVVPGLAASAVVVGFNHACVLEAGGVKCWGGNERGQRGDGTTSPSAQPTAVELPRPVSLSASESHTCAVLPDGAVWCWGENRDGQLGDGTAGYRTLPAQLAPFPE
jgi:alpha-tubulin suppressor-like RCC1 family protein